MLTLAHRMMLGAASRPKNDARIITLAGPSAQSDSGRCLAFDADGNRLLAGQGGSTLAGYLTKLNSAGAIVWQRKLTLAVSASLSGVAVDQVTGDVYVCGSGRDSGSINFFYTAKYNASGTLQWQRKISAAYAIYANSIALDASGNVFVLGLMSDTISKVLIVKYSSGGVQQWQRVVSHGSEKLLTAQSLALDGSGNVYFATSREVSGSDRWPALVKCNSSGVIQMQVALRLASSGNQYGYSVALDGAGNIYLGGTLDVSGTVRPFLCKLNSSGAVQWLRHITSAYGSFQQFYALAVSAAGHVYGWGNNRVFKFATADGALVWQREMKASTNMNSTNAVAHRDAALHFYTTFNSLSGDTDAGAVTLPDSGEGTGTYGGLITYSESTDTTTAASPSTATPAFTDAAGALTEAAGDMTDAAGNLTATDRVKTA